MTLYNPMQGRLDYLQNQKQMIEQQMANLQQYTIPPININNNNIPSAASVPASFDFNGKWVGNEQEAKGVANNNLPLILFDKSNPIFYIKNLDGSFKKFQFSEIIETPTATNNDTRLDQLEAKLEAILTSLNTPKNNNIKDTAPKDNQKNNPKGGKHNEQSAI